MRQTISKLTLAMLATLMAGSFANAQLTIGDFAPVGTRFTTEIALDGAGISIVRPNNGGDGSFASDNADAIFNGSPFTTDITSTFASITTTETFTDLNDGNGGFQLEISIASTGNLSPILTLDQGTPDTSDDTMTTDTRFSIGTLSSVVGGVTVPATPLTGIADHSLSEATIATFDQDGELIVSESALGLFAFTDPDDPNNAEFQGFLNTNIEGGSLGTLGANAVTGAPRVSEVRLTIVGTLPVSAVPEPTSAALLFGMGLIGLAKRRRNS